MLSAKPAFRLFLLLALCLSTLVFARAQSATATLSGTVTDENGAIVPGASITVTNPATGLQRQATTGDSGTFTIPLLPPSTYTVLVERQGFATAKLSDVVLNVNDQRSLRIQLKVGQISGETVNVNADANVIREDPAVATVVDRQFVANLPLNGRSFESLIELTPGTVEPQDYVERQTRLPSVLTFGTLPFNPRLRTSTISDRHLERHGDG